MTSGGVFYKVGHSKIFEVDNEQKSLEGFAQRLFHKVLEIILTRLDQPSDVDQSLGNSVLKT